MKLASADGEEEPLTPDEIDGIRVRLEGLRGGRPAEVVVSEEIVTATPLDTGRLRALGDAGVTWYLDGLGTRYLALEALFDRVRQGPPQL